MRSAYLQNVYNQVLARDPDQREFQQAVLEVLESLDLIVGDHPEYEANGIIESFVEPERMVCFRVPWIDDQGRTRVNRGYRVQFSSSIGPYKGGLREIVSKRYAKGRFYGKIEQKGTKGRKWDGIYFRDRQESVLDKQLGRCNR